MQKKLRRVLFVVQYPENVSPGQRFRVELYKELLLKNGFIVATSPFLNQYGYNIIHSKNKVIPKVFVVLNGFLKRIGLIFGLKAYDYIFLQREASPVGPPFFEWAITKIWRKKVIYDFDDAIWIPHISDSNSKFVNLKNTGKVEKICRWVHKVSCGNQYLCDYAKQFNANVVYNPTCVDTENRHNVFASHQVSKVTIGWTGSFSTLKYLYILHPVFEKLQRQYNFSIKVICNQPPSLNLRNVEYVEWTEENEINELAACQIGLMPLTDDEWSKGKCGFKIIQYLALKIPAVSSAVGVNSAIIENGVNGFLCTTEQEWYDALEKLITDGTLRESMGHEGRKKIMEQYSLHSNTSNFLSLFD